MNAQRETTSNVGSIQVGLKSERSSEIRNVSLDEHETLYKPEDDLMPHTVTRPPKLPVMIDLTTISTPKQAAITVSPGEIDPALVEQGREARVRSLPIVSNN